MKKPGNVTSMEAALRKMIAEVKRDIKRLEREKRGNEKEVARLRDIVEGRRQK